MKLIEFFVAGTPATSGSKTGFYNPKIKRVIMVPANKKQKPWMAHVRAVAVEKFERAPITGPVKFCANFFLLRPKTHYGSGKNSEQVKASSPEYPQGRPDLFKLVRAVEDSLTGIVYKDDSLIVSVEAVKLYCDNARPTPGVWVRIEEL